MSITHATRSSAPKLHLYPDAPNGEQWIFQAGCPFQISPTEAAISANIRLGKTRVVDLEVGSDFVIFDDLETLDTSRLVPTVRGGVKKHPRTGDEVYMSFSIAMPGFVPLGAKRDDGSDHPHAGTGFGIAFSHGFPTKLAENEDTHIDVKDDICGEVHLMQLSYDGKTFKVTDVEVFDDREYIKGTASLFGFWGAAIPSGDDLITLFDSGSFEKWDTGFVRWRRGDDGKWSMAEHKVHWENTCESSLLRDQDGSLLALMRPWGATNTEPTMLQLYRSADEGKSWTRICKQDMRWQMCPIMLNKAADGTPYVIMNRFREPRISRFATREMLWAYPLSDDRQSLGEPVIIRDASSGFGPPPNDTVWRVDHAMGETLRLRGGKYRHLLVYRGLEDAEMRTDAGATPMTGTYVEEVFSDGGGEPVSTWKF